jgi:hypothetical protein
MKYYCFIVALVLLLPSLIKAQQPGDGSPKDSLIKANVIHNGRYSGIVYTQHNEVLTSFALKSVLNTYSNSAIELKSYYTQKRTAILILPITVTAMIIGFIQAANNKDMAGSAFRKAPLPFSISIAGIISSVIIGTTNKHLHKSIEMYNANLK